MQFSDKSKNINSLNRIKDSRVFLNWETDLGADKLETDVFMLIGDLKTDQMSQQIILSYKQLLNCIILIEYYKIFKNFEILKFLKFYIQQLLQMSDPALFETTKGWSFSQKDQLAHTKLGNLLELNRHALPQNFHRHETLGIIDKVRNTELYNLLKTIPKGVIHHLHFDCNEDLEFYAKYIAKNPIVYLDQALKEFKIGSKTDAEKQNWLSMEDVRKKYNNDQQFCKFLLNKSTLNTEQMVKYTGHKQCWTIFEEKIAGFFPLLGTLSIFKDYFRHTCLKLIRNGYQRLQFRAMIGKLKQYDQQGNFVKQHDQQFFTKVIDQIMDQINKEYPDFTVGFVAFGLKALTPEQNEQILTKVCSFNWSRLLGIDFVQQEDLFGSQKPYVQIADKVLQKFPDKNYKKVFHSGQTRDALNNNVQISVQGGSARIGHGVNIIQRPFLKQIIEKREVCFQINPVSNVFLGFIDDPRKSHGFTLFNLGVPVSLSSDDPGKLNNDDTTFDYWITVMSSEWGLKELKLVAIYSINHAICSEDQKQKMMGNFNKKWDTWVSQYIK